MNHVGKQRQQDNARGLGCFVIVAAMWAMFFGGYSFRARLGPEPEPPKPAVDLSAWSWVVHGPDEPVPPEGIAMFDCEQSLTHRPSGLVIRWIPTPEPLWSQLYTEDAGHPEIRLTYPTIAECLADCRAKGVWFSDPVFGKRPPVSPAELLRVVESSWGALSVHLGRLDTAETGEQPCQTSKK